MDVTSLTETWGTWAGFISQAVIRREMAAVTIAGIGLGTLVVAARGGATLRPFSIGADMMRYWFMTLLIIVLFQPELFRLGSITNRPVPGSDIQSFVAAENGGTVQTAQQLATTRGVTPPIPKVPHLVYLIVRSASGISTAIGKTLSEDTSRPGSSIYPLSTFANYQLPSRLVVTIQNWTANCVIPAKATLSATDANYTDDDLRLAPGTALWEVMSSMRKPTGVGVLNLVIELKNCAAFGQELRSRAIAAITADQTPNGIPFATLWESEIGIQPEDAAEHFITVVVERSQEEGVPPPSLIGRYLGIQTLAAIPKAFKTFQNGGGLLGSLGMLLLGGAVNSADAALSGLARVAAIGLYFNHVFPVFLGQAQTVVLSLLPVAVLWSVASPGHHIRPLGLWIASVAIAYSGPMIFGLIGLMSNFYGAANLDFAPQELQTWVGHHIGIILIQSSGPLVFLLVAAAIGGTSLGISRIGRGM